MDSTNMDTLKPRTSLQQIKMQTAPRSPPRDFIPKSIRKADSQSKMVNPIVFTKLNDENK